LYLTDRLQKSDLVALLRKLNMTPIQLTRRNERSFKSLIMNKEEPADDILIDAMISDPTLIERPIVVVGDKAVIGRPPESILRLIQ
jgi:arsenate reductase